mmetsp:Transcript_963/g.1733  ORF Transcript_963/g.1733 Transcript_963/m.1733 type:complete len:487 (-) Transcript_963:427-1887(-)
MSAAALTSRLRREWIKHAPSMSRYLTTTTDEFFDVAIVGGGAAGSCLANLLRKNLPDLRVALLEARENPPSQPPAERVPNPRSYALSPQSLKILGESVHSTLDDRLGYYDSMQVWQANSPSTLTFTSRDLDADPEKSTYLGACCEDQALVATLWEEIQAAEVTECLTDTRLKSVKCGDSTMLASAQTEDGSIIRASVLVGADGGNSWVRKAAGISRIGGEYEQHALTFTVSLTDPIMRRAFQRYLVDGGPLALLPTYSPKHAVVVWSTSPETLSEWKGACDEDLVHHLNSCLREGPQRVPSFMEDNMNQSWSAGGIFSNIAYGAERVLDAVHYGLAMASQHPNPTFLVPPTISGIASPKFTFPLSCFQATTYVKGRIALVADAAHTVHPMAGQGLNLGLADVRALVDSLEKAHSSGMDLSSFLHEYNSNRHRSVSVSLGGIHALQRLFRNQDTLLTHAKTFGLNVVQNVGPLRRQLAVAAAHGIAI